MKLQNLLYELKNNTYAMLMPSKIHGIGVFAIRDIKKGCRAIFSNPNEEGYEYIKVLKTEIAQLPTHAKALIENFCLYDDENYFVPEKGFKIIDLVMYLNHSENPNLLSINDGDYFEALRDIKAGEELLIDYGDIVD